MLIGTIVDILNAGTYSYLWLKLPEAAGHAFTWGIMVSSISAFVGSPVIVSNTTVDGIYWDAAIPDNTTCYSGSDTAEWDWFSWAKRLSLLGGWLGFFLAWQGTARGNVYGARFFQGVLMLNVAEAGAVMLVQGNVVGGGLGLALATVSLDYNFIDQAGRLCCLEEATFFGRNLTRFKLTARWYTRIYYVILSFLLCFHPRFANFWLFVYITCLWPLLYQEVIDRRANVGQLFKVRAFMLILQAAFLDTFIDGKSIEASTGLIGQHPAITGFAMLNGLSLAIVAVFFAAFYFLDRHHGRLDAARASVANELALDVIGVGSVELKQDRHWRQSRAPSAGRDDAGRDDAVPDEA